MPDPDQHRRHTTGSIADSLGAELLGPHDLVISSVDSLDHAGPQAITFIRSARFAARWAESCAGAALVTRDVEVAGHDPSRRALIIVKDADMAMATLLKLFAPLKRQLPPGIHPSAIVDSSATIGYGVHIGPNCVVGPDTTIGDGGTLIANVCIGADVTIGPLCTLHPGVCVMDRCTIGSACTLWPNVTIGADGFGYLPAPDGRGLTKVPHVGSVKVGNAVEIGAGSCIDRGKFGATTIGDMTKIDNLVQIGHNVVIGRCCLICALTGIGGSTTLGDGCVVGGHVGIADAVTLGDRVQVAGKAGVAGSIPAGQTIFGYPAWPAAHASRCYAALHKLPEYVKRIRSLEAQLAGLTGPDSETNEPTS